MNALDELGMLDVCINPVLINGETIKASPRTSFNESTIDTGECVGVVAAAPVCPPPVCDLVQSVYSLLIVSNIS